MKNQVSIKESVKVEGLNVYNGRKNSAIFHPAEEDSGIAFLVKGEKVPARLEFANHQKKGIALNNGWQKAYLVEHLLSAVYGLHIDNLIIELSDGVCPTTDNCAREYFDSLNDVLAEQSSSRSFWRYSGEDSTYVRSGDIDMADYLVVKSSEGFMIRYMAFYPHKVVGAQYHGFQVDPVNYSGEIADARPPGFLKSGLVNLLCTLSQNLGLHGVTDRNYLKITSIDAPHYANPVPFGPRYGGKEFVRHKLLDVMGTLALTGRQFADTEFQFNMTGHRFDLYALKKLFSDGKFEEYRIE